MPTPNEKPTKSDRFPELAKEVWNFILLYSIPFFIALSAWFLISTIFRLYRLNIFLIYGIFAVVVPGVTILASNVIVRVIEISKEPANKTKHPETKGTVFWKKLIGFVFTAVLTVITVWVPFNGRETIFSMLLNRMVYGSEYPFISNIGDVTISSGTDAKIQGIDTLETIHSTKSLDELFRVFVDDHESINNYDVYDALSKAMASFPESRDRLLEMFVQSDEFQSDLPRGITPNLYDRYFAQSFNNLRDEIKKNILDPQARDEQLYGIDEIELQLKATLLALENEKYLPEGGDPTLDFVLDTFIRMKIEKDDKEVYFLARNVAVDPTYAIGTRVRAIDLWAKLGTPNDFEQIVILLECDDEQIRQAALRAIATVHSNAKNIEDEDTK